MVMFPATWAPLARILIFATLTTVRRVAEDHHDRDQDEEAVVLQELTHVTLPSGCRDALPDQFTGHSFVG